MSSHPIASFRFALAVVVGMSSFTACAPAKPQGPQPAGVTSRAFVGQAELELRYRFEPKSPKEVELFVDAVARTGASGPVKLSVALDGLTVLQGEPSWEVTVEPSRTATHQLTLRLAGTLGSVTVVTHHVERDVELARDTIRFWADEDGLVAECQAEDEACR